MRTVHVHIEWINEAHSVHTTSLSHRSIEGWMAFIRKSIFKEKWDKLIRCVWY